MTIRRILLLAFLLVSLVPATVLTLLAFICTHAAMQGQIEQTVLRSATAVSSDVDKLLYERMLNATTWNHLEVMQDLRLDDVDKRLSSFLAEMNHRYGGVYLALDAVDGQGRIVASSEPARIGKPRPAASTWLAANLPGGQVRIDRPDAAREGRHLALRSSIASQFGPGSLGELVLDVDYRQLERLLDSASDPARQVLILDPGGALIAASAGLRAAGFDYGQPLPGWISGAQLERRAGAPLMAGDVVLGRQRTDGSGRFAGFGWSTLLMQSREVAMAPVHRMGWVFAGLLAATAVVTALASLAVAGSIARPVVALTDYTRGYLRPGPPPTPPPPGPGEVGELNRSFVRLVEDLQRSQQTLVQASKLAALGEITALMAHEVRTPLGILRSSAQMLRGEPGLSEEGAELLLIIESETARLNRLVSSMLDSARTRPPQRHATDVHGLMAHAVSLLASQARDRGVKVELLPEAETFVADCDAEQLTQVLLNLVMNALQILPRGGQVQLRTRNEQERLVIEVADDGPGIPVDERQRLFEPFVYKREGGVGLGLAVVRQIVRAHGGEVLADASALGGALFRLWIPLHNPDRT